LKNCTPVFTGINKVVVGLGIKISYLEK